MDKVEAILAQTRDAMTVKRVFGDPIERDGITVIPVARVGGGGGGGGSTHGAAEEQGGSQETMGGGGVGYGLSATPAGVYVIKNGEVSWEPAVDVNRIVMGGQIVGAIALLLIFRYLRGRQRAS